MPIRFESNYKPHVDASGSDAAHLKTTAAVKNTVDPGSQILTAGPSSISLTQLANFSLSSGYQFPNKLTGGQSNPTNVKGSPVNSAANNNTVHRVAVNSTNSFSGNPNLRVGGGGSAILNSPSLNINHALVEALLTGQKIGNGLTKIASAVGVTPLGWTAPGIAVRAASVGIGVALYEAGTWGLNRLLNNDTHQRLVGTFDKPGPIIETVPMDQPKIEQLKGRPINDPTLPDDMGIEGYNPISPKWLNPYGGKGNGADVINTDLTRLPGTAEVSNNNPRNFILLKDDEAALAKLKELSSQPPFEYAVSPERTTPERYELFDSASGKRVPYKVSHRLAPGELAETPDGRMLIRSSDGDFIKEVPDGVYYFGSVRGRTGIVQMTPDLMADQLTDEPPLFHRSDRRGYVFKVTQMSPPELWGILRVDRGRVVSRENLGGIIRPPSSDNLYVNHYPGDVNLLSDTEVWKLELDQKNDLGSQGRYLLKNKENIKVTDATDLYSFIWTPTLGMYAVGSNGRHLNIAMYLERQQRELQPTSVYHRPMGSIPVVFAGDIYLEQGYLKWWNDRTGHFKVSQYHARDVGLPMEKFAPYTWSHDYLFGPPVNRWYAQATPVAFEDK